MCVAIPGKVIGVTGLKAVVDYGESQSPVIVDVEGLKVGDWVQVQMGIAIKILTPAEAKASLAAWSELLQDQTIDHKAE